MSGPKEDLANGAEADAVPSGGSLIGTAESAEMEANVLRFDDDNRNAVILRGGESTKAVHGGERQKGGVKGYATLNALTTPIVQSSTFTFRNTAEILAFNESTESSEYGRYGNPTVRAAEEKILALENAEDCLVSASGMNAVTTMLLALVDSNGHVVLTTDCYRRTLQFVTSVLPKMGVRLTVIDPSDVDELERILQTEGATLFFSEQITNPLCRIIDTERIARLCQQYKCICCIDTTFCTPINHRPIELGADLVLTSGTKYLAGHNDVMCGALSGKRELVDHVRKLYRVLGGAFACMHAYTRARTPTLARTRAHTPPTHTPARTNTKPTQLCLTQNHAGVVDPHAAFMLLRGLKTLSLRVQQQNANAQAMADFLDKHPVIAKVHYPSLSHHRDNDVARRKSMFAKGFGGVLSFEIKGDGNPWSQVSCA